MKTCKYSGMILLLGAFICGFAQRIEFKKFHPETSFEMRKIQYGLGSLIKSCYRNVPFEFYPMYMNTSCKVKEIESIDTLEYQWCADTIVNINFYYVTQYDDHLDLENNSIIFSNRDNIYVNSLYESKRYPIFLNEKFIEYVRRWDTDSLHNNYSISSTTNQAKISRIVINEGKVLEFDTLTVYYSRKI